MNINPKSDLSRVLIARILLIIFSTTLIPILPAHAITTGPSQPEVASFTPASASDMVNLFTGDFSYNIPLLDVEGYPVNISYNAGANMEQEASWVGLGWNLNPGAINREIRGLPDDFNGEIVEKQTNLKPSNTVTVDVGGSLEIVGLNINSLSGGDNFSFSLGVKVNNYSGYSLAASTLSTLSLGSNKDCPPFLNVSLGIGTSSADGLSIQPKLGLKSREFCNSLSDFDLSTSVGLSYNSLAGLSDLSFSIGADISRRYKTYAYQEGEITSTYSILNKTYSPSLQLPMSTFGVEGKFKLGPAFLFSHFQEIVGGSFTSQFIAKENRRVKSPGFGLLYANKVQGNKDALLDFRRDNDGPVLNSTQDLAYSSTTPDIYMVSSQGIGGDYKLISGNHTYVYDPEVNSYGGAGDVGFDFGLGPGSHNGVDISATFNYSSGGLWRRENEPRNELDEKSTNSLHEAVYFKRAGDMGANQNLAFSSIYGGYQPVRYGIRHINTKQARLKSAIENSSGATISDLTSGSISINKRMQRTDVLTYLTKNEYSAFALDPTYPIHNEAKRDHIASVSIQGKDGARYYYEQPVYNNYKEEVVFACGSTEINSLPVYDINLNFSNHSGLIYYPNSYNDIDNTKGIDHYYNRVKYPAYAYSYLLTSIVSSDYSDIDNIKGPSDKDLGNFTKFTYKNVTMGANGDQKFRWRFPYSLDSNYGSYNEGLKSDYRDDRVNIVYGEKEIKYLEKIITRNQIAVFYSSSRFDGHGCIGPNGGRDLNQISLRLDSIALFVKSEYEQYGDAGEPIKKVLFDYDYSLCPGVPNNQNVSSSWDLSTSVNLPNEGKLTLKRIYFSYGKSFKSRLSPYVFTYSSTYQGVNNNFPYCPGAMDRWGNYKPVLSTTSGTYGQSNGAIPPTITNQLPSYLSGPLPNGEYPYVEQNMDNWVNFYASAWNLSSITLPSGGKIQIEYEADDYAFVQDVPATQMIHVVDYKCLDDYQAAGYALPAQGAKISLNSGGCNASDFKYFLFEMEQNGQDWKQYISIGQMMYFRFLINIRETPANHITIPSRDHFEYVSGYAKVHDADKITINGKDYVVVRFDNLDGMNRIQYAGIQFGRLNMPRVVWNNDDGSGEDVAGFSEGLIKRIINSNLFKTMRDAVNGINNTLKDFGVAKEFVSAKAWFRVNTPDGRKKGGGHRVKSIIIDDNWGNMLATTPISGESSQYSQQYSYINADGTSSGVASYEPEIGGDENAMKKPIFMDEKVLLAQDNFHYNEEPFGDSYFPAPVVGYSKVTVINNPTPGLEKHATGKVVHEFYTAKEFPVITGRTPILPSPFQSFPLGLQSISNIYRIVDYKTLSQGYYVETNDMHGKPKSTSVFKQGSSDPISKVEYRYLKKSRGVGENSFQLENQVKVINADGTVEDAEIGVEFETISDFRESKTETITAGVTANMDIVTAFIFVLFGPSLYPKLNQQITRFRSAVITKAVHRYGILSEVIKTDLGSTVNTRNEAFSADTGEPLLTSSNNEFNDRIYKLDLPAYWYYSSMGPYYLSVDARINNIVIQVPANGNSYFNYSGSVFYEGDVLGLTTQFGGTECWVRKVNGNKIEVMLKSGANVPPGTYNLRLLQPGKKNLLYQKMASIITTSSPLETIKSNVYSNVLQADAVLFKDSWKTYCGCFNDYLTGVSFSNNDYVLGVKGIWRPWKQFSFLTDRNQSRYNLNTNIRNDGKLTSFQPFYFIDGHKWSLNYANWTYTSEVSEYHPFGHEIENIDALNNKSAAVFGYGQSKSVIVASNSAYTESGADNFEDYAFNPCVDDHFKFENPQISSEKSHSGRFSSKVTDGVPVVMLRNVPGQCEPPSPCLTNLSVESIPATVSEFIINPTPQNAQYYLTWEVINGSPLVYLVNNATGIHVIGASWTIKVKVTDETGCMVEKIISNP